MRALRRFLTRHGVRAPIEVTEFGAPAAYVPFGQWATDLTGTVRDLATSGCGITRIIAYRDQDPITGTGVVDQFAYYTMYDRDGRTTGLANAYFAGIAGAKRAAKRSASRC
jgi:hypothetical protein